VVAVSQIRACCSTCGRSVRAYGQPKPAIEVRTGRGPEVALVTPRQLDYVAKEHCGREHVDEPSFDVDDRETCECRDGGVLCPGVGEVCR
jgi:hypothetical protein